MFDYTFLYALPQETSDRYNMASLLTSLYFVVDLCAITASIFIHSFIHTSWTHTSSNSTFHYIYSYLFLSRLSFKYYLPKQFLTNFLHTKNQICMLFIQYLSFVSKCAFYSNIYNYTVFPYKGLSYDSGHLLDLL